MVALNLHIFVHHRPPLFASFDQNTTLVSSRPFATVPGKHMNSFLATFLFVSFFSWTGPQNKHRKTTRREQYADSHNNTDLVRFVAQTYLSYNCILEGGRGVLLPTRYTCKKWQSSQQMDDMQLRLECGISRHAHARKKLTVVSSGCIWRWILPSSGSIGPPWKPLPKRWHNNISQGE